MPNHLHGVVSVSFHEMSAFVGSVVMADLSARSERPSEFSEDEIVIEMEKVRTWMKKVEKVIVFIDFDIEMMNDDGGGGYWFMM